MSERNDNDDGAEIVLGSELGRGGMGVVRTAWQVPLGREVAVKLVLPAAGEKSRRALVDEAAIAGALEHPNIPPVHLLAATEDGRPVLLMKRVDGVAWADMLGDPDHPRWRSVAGGRLDWNLAVLMQVANAIQFAHTHGFVHRDLKPNNVMIGEFGEVYVLDWGIAARIDALAEELAATGRTELVGTPAYVAPEMIDPTIGPVGRRTDVYLLGGILHEVLTSEPPHAKRDLVGALMEALSREVPEYPDDVPDQLSAVARRALSPSPEDRFDSAESLRSALLEFLQTRDSVRILARANEGLETLRSLAANPEQNRVEVYRVFGECRFAFEEALSIRPELDEAVHGRRDALQTMTELELARGNPDGAELLLAELAAAGADNDTRERLSKATAEARQKAAALAEDHQRLKSMEADIDVTHGSRARAYVALAIMALVVLGGRSLILEFDRPEAAARLSLVAALIVVGLVMRKTLLANAATRRLSFSVLALAVVAPLHLFLGWIIGLEHDRVLPVDLLFLSSGLALIAISLDPRTGWSAAIALVGAFASAYHQAHAYVIVAVTLVLVAGIQIVLWGRARPNGES